MRKRYPLALVLLCSIPGVRPDDGDAFAQQITTLGSQPRGGASVPTMAGTGFLSFTTTQGTATIGNSSIGVTLADSDQGHDQIRAVCKNAPATPYTLTGKFSLTAAYGQGADSWGGFAWRDNANGHMIGYGVLNRTDQNVPSVFSIDFLDPVNNNASGEGAVTTFQTTMWLQIRDDGTSAIETYSMDGVNYNQLSSVAKSSGFLGSNGYNQVCIFVSAHGSAAKLGLQGYTQTSP
jgi:hypothetical protein